MYHFININGECTLPNPEQIILQALLGNKFLIQVDSSVLLDLVGIVNKWNLPENNIEKAIEFIEYQKVNKIDVSGALSVQELALDRVSKKYNEEIYNDYANKFLFALELSKEQIIEKDFCYNEKFSNQKHSLPPSEYADIRVEMCNRSYVALLKIRQLAFKNGVSEKNALKNIEEFLYWMKNELGLIMAVELQLAIYVFGGINDFTEMIWLKKDKSKIFQKLWGTAMDISFFRFLQMMESTKKELGIRDISIFATKDRKQFRLIKEIQTISVVKNLPHNPIIPQVELNILNTFFSKKEDEFKRITDKYSGSINKNDFIFRTDFMISKIEELERINENLSW
ncbi:hypothetical protein D1632_08755 [Chryseobacterium nematophagum]|uniref:Uncharacterized protein n=1 Tax=Chryseobacterium nematophagum TaxID=2305228 RepID=A0A3M7LCC3_9FLAO|nr:hypothetical protein [Chryseobacterium nematophagum]RMZ59704.1 hypothetical protein D1632_08755 [Chryseobacterium nematophagum]